MTSKEIALNWLKAALVRAFKTFAQSLLALLTLNKPVGGIIDIAWIPLLSVACLAAFMSILTSIVGLPEVKTD
jgi:hypothetical protein